MPKSPAEADRKPLTVRDVHVPFRVLTDRWAELCRREDEASRELADLVFEFQAEETRALLFGHSDPKPGFRVTPPRRVNPLDAAARELLGDLAPAEPEPENPTGKPIVVVDDPRRARAAELSAELDKLRAAKELIQPVIDRERESASRLLCAELKEQHGALARQVVAAFAALGDAMVAYRGFFESHREHGPNLAHLRPVPIEFNGLGDPRDPQSEFRYWLRTVADQGHAESSMGERWPAPKRAGAIVNRDNKGRMPMIRMRVGSRGLKVVPSDPMAARRDRLASAALD